MKLPIYELVINPEENNDAEVSYIALVDAPAIKKDFLAFNEEFVQPGKGEPEGEFMPRCIKYMIDEGKEQEQAVAICSSLWEEHFAESYNDYPEAAKEAAQTALRWAEENGWGDCGTPVGKARANQLAKGEPITRETIARMAAFDRHRENSDKPLGDGCGRLMWLAWGGDAGVAWAQRKLKQIDREKTQARQAFAIQSEDERIITGPLMVPEQLIYRNNERFGEHYVKFTAETIRQIAIKFAKKGYQKNVNLMHDSEMQPKDVTMFESFISDSTRGIKPMEAFSDLPDGTWFGSFYVENPEVWKLVKEGQVRGFSVEGLFDYETPESLEEKYSKLVINELAEIFKHF